MYTYLYVYMVMVYQPCAMFEGLYSTDVRNTRFNFTYNDHCHCGVESHLHWLALGGHYFWVSGL